MIQLVYTIGFGLSFVMLLLAVCLPLMRDPIVDSESMRKAAKLYVAARCAEISSVVFFVSSVILLIFGK